MKHIPKLVLSIIALAVVVSCASAPEPAPEPTPPPVATAPAPPAVPRPDAEQARARELRDVVLEYELSQFASQEFQEAEALFAAGEAAIGRDNDAARLSYEQAIARYTTVIERGVTSVVTRKRSEVQQARQQADSIRSRVTQQQTYDRAVAEAETAEAHLTGERFLEAVASFDQARDGFLSAYRSANELRERARRAIDSADAAISGSERDITDLESDLQAEE